MFDVRVRRVKNPVWGPNGCPGITPELKNLLIETQRMNDVFVLEARERFGKDVGELLICRDVFDIEGAAFVMISYEVITDIDMFRSLIIRFAVDDGFGSFVIGKKRWMCDFHGDGVEEHEVSQ